MLIFYHFAAKCGGILIFQPKNVQFFCSVFTFIFNKICVNCRLKNINLFVIILSVYSGHGQHYKLLRRGQSPGIIYEIKSRCRYHRGFFRGSGVRSVKHSAENETEAQGVGTARQSCIESRPGFPKYKEASSIVLRCSIKKHPEEYRRQYAAVICCVV